MGDDPKESLPGIGITIHEILRYAYAGFLPLFLFTLLRWEDIKDKVPAKDGVTGFVLLVVAFALTGGTVVYSLHRVLLGDWFFEFLHDSIHRLCSSTSKRRYLETHHKVPRRSSLNAFRIVRDVHFEDKFRSVFYRQHSEALVLYITALCLMVADLLMWTYLGEKINGVDRTLYHWWLAGLAALCWVAAIGYDIIISRQECCYLQYLDRAPVGVDEAQRSGEGLSGTLSPFQRDAEPQHPLRLALQWAAAAGVVAVLAGWIYSPGAVGGPLEWAFVRWPISIASAAGVVVWFFNASTRSVPAMGWEVPITWAGLREWWSPSKAGR
jgi:hypothetical protein